jgi:hypothetical protein
MPAADVEQYMAQTNAKIRKVLAALHNTFETENCTAYVKTIYIGYDIDGVMTAAAYAHSDHVEVALAVAEDHPDDRLKDASHLTWRTLPLAIELRTVTDVTKATPLIHEACERIRNQNHHVHRDNDYFMRKRGRSR